MNRLFTVPPGEKLLRNLAQVKKYEPVGYKEGRKKVVSETRKGKKTINDITEPLLKVSLIEGKGKIIE
jgi:hypothetical protein